MRAALEAAKAHFGPGALILGTRVVPAGGLGRLAGRETVELTAAPPAHGAAPQIKSAGRTTAPRAELDGGRPPAPVPVSEALLPLYTQLVRREVSEELAGRLLREAGAERPGGGDALRDAARRAIARMIPRGGLSVPAGERASVALVGPAAGGKTTTLAKLAAQLHLRQGRRVGILSLDLHRLGAHEQMRSYAEIIGVPFRSAGHVPEVRDALAAIGDVEVLLIDTFGVGARDNGRFARLAALLRAAHAREIQLVLPATASPATQLHLSRAFAPLKPDGLILTHLDDAVGLGVILDAVDRVGLRLSYISGGQNVPRDLDEACGEHIAGLLLAADH